jgi:hypothetical protein
MNNLYWNVSRAWMMLVLFPTSVSPDSQVMIGAALWNLSSKEADSIQYAEKSHLLDETRNRKGKLSSELGAKAGGEFSAIFLNNLILEIFCFPKQHGFLEIR